MVAFRFLGICLHLHVHICYYWNHKIFTVITYSYTDFFVINCMYYLVIAKLLQKLVVVTLWKWKLFQKKKKSIFFSSLDSS